MTERSLFWTDGTGDGGPYSQSELRLMVKALAGVEDNTTDGVFRGQLDEFSAAIAGPTSRVDVETGRGQVDGTIYESDATTQLTPSTPSVGTTGGSVVLEKNWSAQTVRLALISSADGTSTPPAVTQTDAVTWQIRLYDFEITTGGVVQNLVDQRSFTGGGDAAVGKVRSITSIQGFNAKFPGMNTSGVGVAWPVANRAIYVRVYNSRDFTASHAFIANGGAPTGNVDIALYDGAKNLIGSTGATAQSGSGTLQYISKSIQVPPGHLILGLSMSATSCTYAAFLSGVMSGLSRAMEVGEQSSAHPLPDPAVPATPTNFGSAGIPLFGFVDELV